MRHTAARAFTTATPASASHAIHSIERASVSTDEEEDAGEEEDLFSFRRRMRRDVANRRQGYGVAEQGDCNNMSLAFTQSNREDGGCKLYSSLKESSYPPRISSPPRRPLFIRLSAIPAPAGEKCSSCGGKEP
eukprot:764012-Hanusia_phi.AAC.6